MTDSLDMKAPNMTNMTSGSGAQEVIVSNGHTESEPNPFAEYMWMEHEEEYNRQVEEELWEEEFLERCFQEMLDEEDQEWFIPERDLPGINQMQQQMNGLSINDSSKTEDLVSKSTLNPDAKEFVPGVKY
ncbi:polyadenylate-binding protein-interacting protein 2B isoform X1 [Amblyraja radiata]|uniref:polyadenylate-binding protein-interacting protein 2B isoform X1 n=2 Tax=Amblyraja radiata TaxID=386614 RepID=UPI0014030627|nr:polyadenylate-binding protein-interacting protein 2B isoform X1 [Amblyraja radiata]XP_055520844.1 polyadenylate-binding protein-interacting protein 2-like isoform X1 [Leucoraja erinacea]XP_055520845.1 polyadenylate-binding protein-interacting protein 2-like isoform X1 [Leucoraja erinacea]